MNSENTNTKTAVRWACLFESVVKQVFTWKFALFLSGAGELVTLESWGKKCLNKKLVKVWRRTQNQKPLHQSQFLALNCMPAPFNKSLLKQRNRWSASVRFADWLQDMFECLLLQRGEQQETVLPFRFRLWIFSSSTLPLGACQHCSVLSK